MAKKYTWETTFSVHIRIMCLFKGRTHIFYLKPFTFFSHWLLGDVCSRVNIYPSLPWKPHYYAGCFCPVVTNILFHFSRRVSIWMKNYVGHLLIGDRRQFSGFLLALEAAQSFPCLPRDGKPFSFNTTSVLANIYWIPLYAMCSESHWRENAFSEDTSLFGDRSSVKVDVNSLSVWNL